MITRKNGSWWASFCDYFGIRQSKQVFECTLTDGSIKSRFSITFGNSSQKRNIGRFPTYATKNEFFSGAGAAKAGGRWNRVGMEAVYASLDITTATQEAYQDFVYRGFPMTAIAPRVTAGAKVTLTKVIDLTDATVRKSIGFTLRDLVEEDWRALQRTGEESWTQAIGRGGYVAEFQGLIVPSARNPGGKNIVIFPSRLAKAGKIAPPRRGSTTRMIHV